MAMFSMLFTLSCSVLDLWRQLAAHEKDVATLKDILTIITVIPAALWALYVFQDGKRKEATARTQQLFGNFYLSTEFAQLRESLEFDYDKKLRPLIERLLRSDKASVSDLEKKALCGLDM